jgi:hypothetical protein
MLNLPQTISSILSTAQHPALLCSFGSDSTLLLHFARQVRRNIPVYFFGDELPKLARQMVIHDDLTVLSYAPADRYLMPHGEGTALIEEYDFNGQRVPMVSPVVSGPRGTCTVESKRPPTSSFYFPHDVVLWGYRATDHHDLLGNVTFEREIQLGHTRFIAPLYDLTTDQVFNMLDVLELDYVSDDAAEFCDECLNAVISSDWDRNAALAGFRARFNLNN